VADAWWVLGQWVEDEERLRVQRTWLWGLSSGRRALVLHFSAAGQPFPGSFAPGTVLEAELAFFPAALPQRALLVEVRGAPRPHAGGFPGHTGARAFLGAVADALATHPWVERLPCALRAVTPTVTPAGSWALRDAHGDALPLRGQGHWRLLALSGGHALDVAGEWDGEALRPLGASTGGSYEALATRDGGPA